MGSELFVPFRDTVKAIDPVAVKDLRVRCYKCGVAFGIKGTRPARKLVDGRYAHDGRCPLELRGLPI